MQYFYKKGTLWTSVDNIIETPLFVNSEFTSMVQVTDLAAYSLRRYFENQEEDLFKKVLKRADRRDTQIVGVRHLADKECGCLNCTSRKEL